jgi:hypothetical protein
VLHFLIVWSKPSSPWVLGKRQIDNQYRIIAELEREGRDTEEAVKLLKQFVEAQENFERDRARLMTKLAAAR